MIAAHAFRSEQDDFWTNRAMSADPTAHKGHPRVFARG